MAVQFVRRAYDALGTLKVRNYVSHRNNIEPAQMAFVDRRQHCPITVGYLYVHAGWPDSKFKPQQPSFVCTTIRR